MKIDWIKFGLWFLLMDKMKKWKLCAGKKSNRNVIDKACLHPLLPYKRAARQPLICPFYLQIADLESWCSCQALSSENDSHISESLRDIIQDKTCSICFTPVCVGSRAATLLAPACSVGIIQGWLLPHLTMVLLGRAGAVGVWALRSLSRRLLKKSNPLDERDKKGGHQIYQKDPATFCCCPRNNLPDPFQWAKMHVHSCPFCTTPRANWIFH